MPERNEERELLRGFDRSLTWTVTGTRGVEVLGGSGRSGPSAVGRALAPSTTPATTPTARSTKRMPAYGAYLRRLGTVTFDASQ